MNGKTDSAATGPNQRVDVIDTQGGRILCVADTRGKISTLNELAAEHNAKAIIHTGDFGFYEPASLPRIADRTLKHLIQYSNLITPQFRSALLAPNVQPAQLRQMLTNPPAQFSGSQANGADTNQFALSEFPKLLNGELRLNVPVYTVWGSCEDVGVLERLRAATPSPIHVPGSSSAAPQPQTNGGSNWSIPNLTVLSESVTRVLVIGNIRLRLFGLGGASVPHKMFDNGDGQATIAGGAGTMWTTVLQVGELIDTAARVYDPSETRLLISHASPGRDGLIAQVALALKADLTISASLHFRYGVSYNEFSVQHDLENYRNKFVVAKGSFNEVWDTVKSQVEAVIDDGQNKFLGNALAVMNRVPAEANASNAQAVEEPAWKNTWNWNLPDAAFGNLVLDIKDGRISSEMRSQGFNFSYRASAGKQHQAPQGNFNPVPTGQANQRPQKPQQNSFHNQRNQQPSQNGPLPPMNQNQSHQNQNQHQNQHNQNQNQNQNHNNQQRPHEHNQNRQNQQKQPYQKKDQPKTPSGAPSEATSAPATESKTESGAVASEPSSSVPASAAQSPNIERPTSSASSRRPSQFKRGGGGYNKGSRDETNSPNADSPTDGNTFDSRGRGRGRGMGNRGRGGNFRGRGGHRNDSDGAPSPSTTPAPTSAAPTPAASSAPAASQPSAA